MIMENIPSACPICDSSVISRKKHSFLSNYLWQCADCGLVFVWPQPSREDLQKIYGNSYFKNNKSQDYGYDDYAKDRENIIKTANYRLKKIEALKPEMGIILDVGCALGYFLEAAQERGWDANGIDISRYAINIAEKKLGARVKCGVLENIAYPKKYFDAIVSWDCIEHVADPSHQVKLFHELLKENGLLVMVTPDTGSIISKVMGDKWMGYKDIEHLFYFSRKSLKILLEKNGFELLKMHFTGKHVTLDLFIRRMALYNKALARMINFLSKIYDPTNVSLYVNPLDIVMVYARKKIIIESLFMDNKNKWY